MCVCVTPQRELIMMPGRVLSGDFILGGERG